MLTHLERVPVDAKPAARPAAPLIERRPSLYRAEAQPRVRALAARHPWLADLAASFPALLFALAFPRVRADAEDALRLIINGAPLIDAARRAGVPMWLRSFPPQAFASRLPILPDDQEFRRRIANHPPRSWKLAPRWIENVAIAAECADADIALWFAREAPLKDKKKKPRYAPRTDNRRLVALWAWYSRHAPDAGHVRTPWREELQWKGAMSSALSWRDRLELIFFLGEDGIADPWLEDGMADGYAFIALRTAHDVDAESAAMKHCVRVYGPSIANNTYRAFSVRKHGERVATLALRAPRPLPEIVEISGHMNERAPIDVWLAARRWLYAQAAAPLDTKRFSYRRAEYAAARWRRVWRPYWLAKRRIPAWLPLAPNERQFVRL